MPVRWRRPRRRRTCCCGGAAAAAPADASQAPPPPRRPGWSSPHSGTPAPAALPAQSDAPWPDVIAICMGCLSASAATLQAHVETPATKQAGSCSAACREACITGSWASTSCSKVHEGLQCLSYWECRKACQLWYHTYAAPCSTHCVCCFRQRSVEQGSRHVGCSSRGACLTFNG